MKTGKYKDIAQKMLNSAGIVINGDAPSDITVYNEDLYERVLTKGSLGFGEAYMDGWWDCKKLDDFFCRILSHKLDTEVLNINDSLRVIKARLLNQGRKSLAFEIGRCHYDIGNDLYRQMLDKRMIYSCGYWKEAHDIDTAQEKKLELICRKLDLKPGMRLLDIGCGWGGTAKYAAEHYGADVVGVTVSEEQVKLAREFCKNLPVEIKLQDYRDIEGIFDRIVSVGMVEHVGVKNYPIYFKIAREHLKEDGIFLLHTIGSNKSQVNTDPWIERYIFPNSMLPSGKQLLEASEEYFVMEDWHNFGAYYDRT
ncbi:MAG: cyclopropane fatty acyl phospholipid synthase, partial [Syntrophales bacterium]|nr:cyclopropane fatty acyl phospholipid synthase [Syntrophales bacterium]